MKSDFSTRWWLFLFFGLVFSSYEKSGKNYQDLNCLSKNLLKDILETEEPPKELQIHIGPNDFFGYNPIDASGIYKLIPYYQRIYPEDVGNASHEPRYIIQKHPINGQYMLTKVEGINRTIIYPQLGQDDPMFHTTIYGKFLQECKGPKTDTSITILTLSQSEQLKQKMWELDTQVKIMEKEAHELRNDNIKYKEMIWKITAKVTENDENIKTEFDKLKEKNLNLLKSSELMSIENETLNETVSELKLKHVEKDNKIFELKETIQTLKKDENEIIHLKTDFVEVKEENLNLNKKVELMKFKNKMLTETISERQLKHVEKVKEKENENLTLRERIHTLEKEMFEKMQKMLKSHENEIAVLKSEKETLQKKEDTKTILQHKFDGDSSESINLSESTFDLNSINASPVLTTRPILSHLLTNNSPFIETGIQKLQTEKDEKTILIDDSTRGSDFLNLSESTMDIDSINQSPVLTEKKTLQYSINDSPFFEQRILKFLTNDNLELQQTKTKKNRNKKKLIEREMKIKNDVPKEIEEKPKVVVDNTEQQNYVLKGMEEAHKISMLQLKIQYDSKSAEVKQKLEHFKNIISDGNLEKIKAPKWEYERLLIYFAIQTACAQVLTKIKEGDPFHDYLDKHLEEKFQVTKENNWWETQGKSIYEKVAKEIFHWARDEIFKKVEMLQDMKKKEKFKMFTENYLEENFRTQFEYELGLHLLGCINFGSRQILEKMQIEIKEIQDIDKHAKRKEIRDQKLKKKNK